MKKFITMACCVAIFGSTTAHLSEEKAAGVIKISKLPDHNKAAALFAERAAEFMRSDDFRRIFLAENRIPQFKKLTGSQMVPYLEQYNDVPLEELAQIRKEARKKYSSGGFAWNTMMKLIKKHNAFLFGDGSHEFVVGWEDLPYVMYIPKISWPSRYENISRLWKTKLINRTINEEDLYDFIYPLDIYLLHVPKQPEVLNDENYVVVQEKIPGKAIPLRELKNLFAHKDTQPDIRYFCEHNTPVRRWSGHFMEFCKKYHAPESVVGPTSRFLARRLPSNPDSNRKNTSFKVSKGSNENAPITMEDYAAFGMSDKVTAIVQAITGSGNWDVPPACMTMFEHKDSGQIMIAFHDTKFPGLCGGPTDEEFPNQRKEQWLWNGMVSGMDELIDYLKSLRG
ncbi:hypothetical protein HOD08_01290 [bacterium]|nr:hypothetical protein [bacterium]